MNKIAVVTFFLLSCASAVAAPFQNGSFELGGVAPCNTFNVPIGSTLITGWTVSAGNIDWLGAPPSCGWQASNGVASLDMVGTGAGGAAGSSTGAGGAAGPFDAGGTGGRTAGDAGAIESCRPMVPRGPAARQPGR